MALNFVVRLYGLDGLVRHSPVLGACRISRIAVDCIWRSRLHFRNRVLLGEASAIQPLDLAPFRERRNGLSFLCRALVCRIARVSGPFFGTGSPKSSSLFATSIVFPWVR